MAFFRYDGQRLAYTIRGDGPRVTVLMPGLNGDEAPDLLVDCASGYRVSWASTLGGQ